MQDTTTNAMTEVALGLAMAFFSLLIVTMISMTMSLQSTTHNDLAGMQNQETINILSNKTSKADKSEREIKQQFVFYYDGELFNETLSPCSLQCIQQKEHLIIAVAKDLNFNEVYELKIRLNHPNLSITTLNKAWTERLSQLN